VSVSEAIEYRRKRRMGRRRRGRTNKDDAITITQRDNATKEVSKKQKGGRKKLGKQKRSSNNCTGLSRPCGFFYVNEVGDYHSRTIYLHNFCLYHL
jgi:hypothetical protein